MGKLAEAAVNNHKNWYSCSGSVLCAFAGEVGLTEREANRLAAPMGSGRMGKCGAVLAAERVLEEKYGKEGAKSYCAELEKAFISKNGSVQCRDLMGTCRRCVTNAAEILETIL